MNARQRAQTTDDFNNEMAGRDVGRIARFFGGAAQSTPNQEKKRAEKQAQLTNLQILMARDPVYAQLYRDTEKRLHEAQNRLDTALETVLLAQGQARGRLEGQLSAAEREEERARLEALLELENDIRSGQAEIGEMQLDMEDGNDPTKSAELEGYQDRSEEIVSDIEDRVSELTASTEVTLEQNSTAPVAGVKIPEL